jgi:hypothetical protein
MPTGEALEQLASARRVADYADRLGIQSVPVVRRRRSDHLGAVLADAVLQAGVSYRTVVEKRVERIKSRFPVAASLSGMLQVVGQIGASEFLLWNHETKLTRFTSLAHLLKSNGIESTEELRYWLLRNHVRDTVIELHGIGPKTYDYMCCLVGIDCIAVDRHVRSFATEAGVTTSDYNGLKSIFSYAADLLGVERREFDAWVWRTVSSRSAKDRQLSLL